MYRTAAWGQDARTRRKPTRTITDCRPREIQLGTSGSPGADFTLAYNYSLPGGATPPGCPVQAQGSGNNGSVIGYTYSDSVKPSYSNSALFVYDSVNRLACAQATGNSTYNLAFSYTQDGSTGQYGNMTCSLNSSTSGPCAQYTFNGANQISGYTYDAAGDMISGGGHTYQYDAEGRLASVDGGTTESYIYNALGQQVRLVSSSYTWDHLYDSAGQWMGRWSNNAWAASGVFHLAGRPFAIYIDQTYFIHVNNLGSTVMTTTPQGVVDGDTQMYPWGQDWLGGTPEWHFAAFQYPATRRRAFIPPSTASTRTVKAAGSLPTREARRSSTSTTPRPGICTPTLGITLRRTLTRPGSSVTTATHRTPVTRMYPQAGTIRKLSW